MASKRKCANCKHWTQRKPGTSFSDFGECDEIEDANTTVTLNTDRIYSWDYEGYRSGAYVGKDFCCHLFELKGV